MRPSLHMRVGDRTFPVTNKFGQPNDLPNLYARDASVVNLDRQLSRFGECVRGGIDGRRNDSPRRGRAPWMAGLDHRVGVASGVAALEGQSSVDRVGGRSRGAVVASRSFGNARSGGKL